MTEGLAVEAGLDRGMSEESLGLRGKDEVVGDALEVEGLDAHAVANEVHALLPVVVERECEHPYQALEEALEAPGKVTSEQDLCVRMVGVEVLSFQLQFVSKFGVIVDLSVED